MVTRLLGRHTIIQRREGYRVSAIRSHSSYGSAARHEWRMNGRDATDKNANIFRPYISSAYGRRDVVLTVIRSSLSCVPPVPDCSSSKRASFFNARAVGPSRKWLITNDNLRQTRPVAIRDDSPLLSFGTLRQAADIEGFPRRRITRDPETCIRAEQCTLADL